MKKQIYFILLSLFRTVKPSDDQVTLTFVDGNRTKGDQDGRKNRKIVDPSGLGLLKTGDETGSEGGDETGSGDETRGPSGCFITTIFWAQ